MERAMQRLLTILLKEQIPYSWLLFVLWAAVISVWAVASISGNSAAFAATAILSILFIGLLV
jgi:3-polyprenyl-4-hydroxybenzoate decarboxylase